MPRIKTSINDYGDLLNVKDMTEITGQSGQTIRRLCKAGKLPSVTIGKLIYVPKTLFIEFLENQLSEVSKKGENDEH